MNNTHKKSLEHTLELLKKFDTFPAYSVLSKALDDAKIPGEVKSRIMQTYKVEIYKQSQIIDDSKDWLKTIVSDLKVE